MSNTPLGPVLSGKTSSGGGEVTPAALLAATAAMTPAQQAELRANIGATDAETSIPDDVKVALLDCFAHVAWVDDQGQTYYDALEAALYPLASISAVYTQSGTVYDTDSLDSLKTDLVVTAVYEGGNTATVAAANYTLSGTLTAGTSTITVSYGGKTATFTVTVTKAPITTFEAGAISKGTTGGWTRYIWKQDASARARMTAPIFNKNYVFTVTDSEKYQLCAYDPETNIAETKTVSGTTRVCYYGGTKSIAWASSDSVTTDYVWLALKKLDNTEFTEEELANGAEAVFTYTEGT